MRKKEHNTHTHTEETISEVEGREKKTEKINVNLKRVRKKHISRDCGRLAWIVRSCDFVCASVVGKQNCCGCAWLLQGVSLPPWDWYMKGICKGTTPNTISFGLCHTLWISPLFFFIPCTPYLIPLSSWKIQHRYSASLSLSLTDTHT